MTKRFSMMTLGAIAAASFATAAFAEPPAYDGSAVSVAVPYGDLNLQRDADVQTLLARISAAARTACGALRQGQLGVHAEHAYRVCQQAALEGGVASVASAKVNAAYAAQTSGRIVLADRRP